MQHTACTYDKRRSSIQVKHVSRETEANVDVNRALFGRRHNTQLLLAVSRQFCRPHDHWRSTAGLSRVLEHIGSKADFFSTRGAVYTSSKGKMVLQKICMSTGCRRHLSSHWTTTPYLIASCILTGSTQRHSRLWRTTRVLKQPRAAVHWRRFSHDPA